MTNEIWRSSSLSFGANRVPPEFHKLFEQYLIPEELSAAVAFSVAHQNSPPQSSLFSFLPLPIDTSLPFHLHASFILSEDRRNIRFDDSGQEPTESSFNRFLLERIIPGVYFSLLHHWPTDAESLSSPRFWPTLPAKDKLSQFVADALFALLHTDQRHICENTSGCRIPPTTVTICGDDTPILVKDVLKLIAPSGLVLGPSSLLKSKLPCVTPAYTRNAILRVEGEFRARFVDGVLSHQMIGETAFYLAPAQTSGSATTENLLLGMPLLPLANNHLDTFQTAASAGNRRLSGASTSCIELFGCDLFVHTTMDSYVASLHTFIPTLNIAPFSDESVSYLVRLRIPPSKERVLSRDDATWIRQLWDRFDTLHSENSLHEGLRNLPLICVTQSSTSLPSQQTFISFAHCHSPSTLLQPFDASQSVVDALLTMGASVVNRDTLPSALRPRLHFMQDSISKLLTFLSSGEPSSIQQRFSLLCALNDPFRKWLEHRLSLAPLRISDVHSLARKLPLFHAPKMHEYASAEQSILLPDGIPLAEALLFLPTLHFVEQHDLLEKLDVTPISFSAFRDHLFESTSSTVCPQAKLSAFRILLASILHAGPNALNQLQDKFLVPNARGKFVSPRTIYSREIDLFRVIMGGRRPDLFIHPELAEEGDPRLGAIGMHVVVDFAAFVVCAKVVHASTDADRILSATAAYDWYRGELARGAQVPLRELDDIAFVPRTLERRKDAPQFNSYATALETVLPPSQMVLANFEAVAWSQRGRFLAQPAPRLLVDHKDLGVPSVDEVVSSNLSFPTNG
jgi:hypothetical protein